MVQLRAFSEKILGTEDLRYRDHERHLQEVAVVLGQLQYLNNRNAPYSAV